MPITSASITVSHESGFYAGLWGSNVDFGNDTDFELYIYGGYAGSIDDNTSFDIGLAYYSYPNAPDGTEYY